MISTDPDTEEEESTKESQDCAPLLDTSLQPSDLTQYYADQNPNSIFCIARAEGNTPTKVIHSEGQAFPIHFPNGKKTKPRQTQYKNINETIFQQ